MVGGVVSGVDLLILAAHPIELAGLSAALGDRLRGHVQDVSVAATDVGVGLTLAGAGAMRRLLEERPRQVIIVGSFGRYPDGCALAPGQLLIPSTFRLIDAAVLAGHAAFPAPMPVTAQPDSALSDALADSADNNVLRGAVATTLAITGDDALAQQLGARSDCIAENLEAMAIGLACSAVGVPWTAVLGCTNTVGAQGRAQWAANHELAASSTSAHLLAWLSAGAPGLQPSAPKGAAR